MIRILFVTLFFYVGALAQEGAIVPIETASWLEKLVEGYPILASVIFVVGILRLVLKPTLSILRNIANATKTIKDNELLDKVERSKILKAVLYALDYLASIKIK